MIPAAYALFETVASQPSLTMRLFSRVPHRQAVTFPPGLRLAKNGLDQKVYARNLHTSTRENNCLCGASAACLPASAIRLQVPAELKDLTCLSKKLEEL